MKNSFRYFAFCFFLLLSFSSCKKEAINSGSPFFAKVYVANEDGESISVINTQTNQVIATIPFNDISGNMMMVHNVQAAPDGKTIWATVNPMNPGSIDQLVVIDPFRDTIITRIFIGEEMHLAHVVLDDACNYAYVTATDSDEVIKVNARTYAVEAKFFLGSGHQPHGMRFSNGHLFISNLGSNTMSIIDVSNGEINEIPVGGMAVQSAVTKDGRFVFSSLYDQKAILKYEVASGITHIIPLPASSEGPIQIYPTPDGSKLFICDQGLLLSRPASNKVFVLDVASETITNTIIAGNAVHGVVVSRDGKTVYVSNSGDNTVSVIDVASMTVFKTIPVGLNPNGIAYWSNLGGQP